MQGVSKINKTLQYFLPMNEDKSLNLRMEAFFFSFWKTLKPFQVFRTTKQAQINISRKAKENLYIPNSAS